MDEDVRRWFESVIDVDDAGVGADGAGVADLPARLAVERGAIQNDFDRLPGLDFLDWSVRTDEPEDARLGDNVLIAEELRRALRQTDVDFSSVRGRSRNASAAPPRLISRCSASASSKPV